MIKYQILTFVAHSNDLSKMTDINKTADDTKKDCADSVEVGGNLWASLRAAIFSKKIVDKSKFGSNKWPLNL